jgi:4-aminobutyrate aminotransferase-like enzyme
MPLACAAALTSLEIHQRDKVWETAASTGTYMFETLRDELKGNKMVKDVRGIGMEIGVELLDSKAREQVTSKAFGAGLHLAATGGSTLQLMPPLTIERSTLDEGIAILVQAIG